MKKSSFLPEKINPNPGGQFAPNLGGHFAPNQVVNLLRIWVVNLTVFSNNSQKNEIEIKLGSIHSVKGQTHCATMYIETDYHGGEIAKLNVEIVKGTKKRQQVLGNNPLFFQKQNFSHRNKVRSNETLKMMYVGFSRPTHLLCFAVRKQNVVNDIQNYLDSGWIIEYI